MAYESYCAACTYLSEKTDSSGKYYCSRKGEDHYATDPKCYSFCEAYGRGNSARENMYDNSKSHSSSGCYLTTTMCTILGYPDDNCYLQTLRMFRDNVLVKDSKYWGILVMYDIVGPEISANLLKDENQKAIAETMFSKYITKAVTAINQNNIEEAKNIYIAMTNTLAELYNINTHIKTPDLEEINISSLGHGRKRTLSQA